MTPTSEDHHPLWSSRLRETPFDVFGIGENSLDRVVLVDEHPPQGAEVPVQGTIHQPGGQIATAALACARLGLRAAYAGTVGDDAAARFALSPLRAAGVDLRQVVTVPGVRTRSATILVHRFSGQRTVLAHRDARLTLRPEQLDRNAICQARVLHLDARDPEAATWAANVARAEGIPVVLDADRVWRGMEGLLSVVDFPIVAREMAEELGGTGSVRDGLRALSSFGAQLAVVTLGEWGALVRNDEGEFESPAYRVKARDTTGAGDAFHAGFVWGLVHGLSRVGVLRAAHAVAAMNCEALGAQGGLPTRRELESFLGSHTPEQWQDPEQEAGR